MGGTRFKVIGLGLALQLAGAPLAAQSGPAQYVPAQPVGMVNDFASVVDAASRSAMEDLLTRLRGAGGAEIAVVTLPTIGDYEASQVALEIGRKWGVGAKGDIGDQRRNAGIVVLLIPRKAGDRNSGQIRVEVGSGLEGIVTDAQAGRVRDAMLPQLGREEYGPGLLTGVQMLVGLVARGMNVSDSALQQFQPPPAGNSGGGSWRQFLPLALILIFFFISSFSRRRRGGIFWGGPWIGGGGWGGGGGFGGGGGGFGGFGGGGGFSGGGAGGRF